MWVLPADHCEGEGDLHECGIALSQGEAEATVRGGPSRVLDRESRRLQQRWDPIGAGQGDQQP